MPKSLLLSSAGNEAIEQHFSGWPLLEVIRCVTDDINMKQPQAHLACGQIFVLAYETIDTICTAENEQKLTALLRNYYAQRLMASIAATHAPDDDQCRQLTVATAMLAAAQFLTRSDPAYFFHCCTALAQGVGKLVGASLCKQLHGNLLNAFRIIDEEAFKQQGLHYIDNDDIEPVSQTVQQIISQLPASPSVPTASSKPPLKIAPRCTTSVYLLLNAMHANGYIQPTISRKEFITRAHRALFGTEPPKGIDQILHGTSIRKATAEEIADELLGNLRTDVVSMLQKLLDGNG